MTELSLEQMLEQVEAQGLRLNNLFQREDGSWQANLRDDAEELAWDWGKGPGPGAALAAALAAALQRQEETALRQQRLQGSEVGGSAAPLAAQSEKTAEDLGL